MITKEGHMITRERSHDHKRGSQGCKESLEHKESCGHKRGSYGSSMIIRWTLWAYLLGSQHKLICWNSIKYSDSEQVPGETDRRSHAHTCASTATAYCAWLLTCQKSLLYSFCAAGLSSNSSSDISRFTWRREESVRSCDRHSGMYVSLSEQVFGKQ